MTLTEAALAYRVAAERLNAEVVNLGAAQDVLAAALKQSEAHRASAREGLGGAKRRYDAAARVLDKATAALQAAAMDEP